MCNHLSVSIPWRFCEGEMVVPCSAPYITILQLSSLEQTKVQSDRHRYQYTHSFRLWNSMSLFVYNNEGKCVAAPCANLQAKLRNHLGHSFRCVLQAKSDQLRGKAFLGHPISVAKIKNGEEEVATFDVTKSLEK